MTTGVVVVGDALLDRDIEGTAERLSPDAPVPVLDERTSRARPGGAALAAALAAADGIPVTLVAPLASDPASRQLRHLLEAAGVEVAAGTLAGCLPEKVRLLSGGHPLLRLDRGGPPGAVAPWDPAVLGRVQEAQVVVVADYGRGVTAGADLRAALASRQGPTLWDPHPRGAAPVPGVTLVTPNLAELPSADAAFPDGACHGLRAVVERTVAARRRWRVRAVATTLGADGALLIDGAGPPLAVPAPPATGDPCGAGDRFIAAVAARLLGGLLLTEAVTEAVTVASEFVAAGGARAFPAGAGITSPAPTPAPGRSSVPLEGASPAVPGCNPLALAERTRAAGGTLVVAGGCFDLLHTGHLSLLRSARLLGDCLIVALNSDASVRRLKGPGRPVVPEADRAAMLGALACVDGVALFAEDTPEVLLDRLRPHIFAKGGDYAADALPEQRTLRRWGGQAVVLPYLRGRSTTRLLETAAARA